MSRIERINEELRHQVSIIVQQELRDPRIGFVTITRVETTPDLREAKIFFTAMDNDKPLEYTINALRNSAGYVRRLIGQRVKMRFTPQIIFMYDDSGDRRNKIDDIIEKLHKEKDER